MRRQRSHKNLRKLCPKLTGLSHSDVTAARSGCSCDSTAAAPLTSTGNFQVSAAIAVPTTTARLLVLAWLADAVS